VETVEPLAAALGAEVLVDPRLGEGTPVEVAWTVLEEHAGSDVVLCSHGDVIPDLVHRSQLRGMRMPERAGYSKGSLWTLRGWDGTTFVAAAWDKLR
jgi:8-oxo-dGTP diphosphatase